VLAGWLFAESWLRLTDALLRSRPPAGPGG